MEYRVTSESRGGDSVGLLPPAPRRCNALEESTRTAGIEFSESLDPIVEAAPSEPTASSGALTNVGHSQFPLAEAVWTCAGASGLAQQPCPPFTCAECSIEGASVAQQQSQQNPGGATRKRASRRPTTLLVEKPVIQSNIYGAPKACQSRVVPVNPGGSRRIPGIQAQGQETP